MGPIRVIRSLGEIGIGKPTIPVGVDSGRARVITGQGQEYYDQLMVDVDGSKPRSSDVERGG